jgi:hypothetical protein
MEGCSGICDSKDQQQEDKDNEEEEEVSKNSKS